MSGNNLNTTIDLYQLISTSIENIDSRKRLIQFRKKGLNSLSGFKKLAFDTRRIDQETEYNPRRGLQTYNRSEMFLSQAMETKLITLAKVRDVLTELKTTYGKEPEWQDSNARILLNTINNGLRTEAKDGDYTETQRGTGSIDYIEELLDMRYRLKLDTISKLAKNDLKQMILNKDEELTRTDINKVVDLTKHDVATKPYDQLLDKLFDGIKATEEHPNVERTVTITIRDSFVKPKE